jgi:hypothetical protein
MTKVFKRKRIETILLKRKIMVSQNQLLGSGVPEQKPITKHIEPTNLKAPAWRFHPECGDRLCKTDAELDKLDAEGWVDHPGKARRLPGHEKTYDAYHAPREDKPTEIQIIKEKTEDEIRADILKAESDKAEEKRIEAERKVEEKRIKDKQKEEEKNLKEEQALEIETLKPEQKSEEDIAKEYEEAKNPPGPRLCTLCGMTFPTLVGLNRHLDRMHKGKKRNHNL